MRRPTYWRCSRTRAIGAPQRYGHSTNAVASPTTTNDASAAHSAAARPRHAGGRVATTTVIRTIAGRNSALALVPSARPHSTPDAATPIAEPRSKAAANASSVSAKNAISGVSLRFEQRSATMRGEVKRSTAATSAAVASKRRRT